ncbi:LINE-1 retrotransposable element ORF2 protein [Nymphon striatum]|nr:LINE-1 retrotransposable element ORF2 protein [Nymphon striatum]
MMKMTENELRVSDVRGTAAPRECSVLSGRGRRLLEAPQVVIKRNPLDRKGRQRLKLATWNVRGLREVGKQQMVGEELDRLNIHIAGLSETFLPESEYLLRPTIRNQRCYKVLTSGCDRNGRRGVALLIDSKYEPCIMKISIRGHTAIGVSLKMDKNILVIIQAYIPDISSSREEVEHAYEEIQEIMSELGTGKNRQLVVMGDLNGRIGRDAIEGICGRYGTGKTNRNGRILINFCRKHGLQLKNTYKSVKDSKNFSWKGDHGHGQSLLDYIAVSKRYNTTLTRCKTVHKVDKLSDHVPIVGTIKIKMNITRQRLKIVRPSDRQWIKNPDNAKLYQDTVENNHPDDDIEWNEVRTIMKSAEEMTMPKKQKVRRKNWMTEEILEVMDRRKCSTTAQEVRQHTRTIRKLCREAKVREMEQKCNEILQAEERNDTRAVFQKVKEMAPRKSHNAGHAIEGEDGEMLILEEEKLKRWQQYMNILYGSQCQQVENIPVVDEVIITKEEFKKAMRSLKNNKASGSDEIPIEFIKAAGTKIHQDIYEIITNIYKGEDIPEDWLETVFLPIPKKARTTKCEQHRTIALIPHAMKIMSKILYNRISLNLNHRLDTMQYGFRPKVGTIESIISLKTILANRIDTKKNTYLCFIDFVKAFDRVEHDKLIKVLKEREVCAMDRKIIADIYRRQKAFMLEDKEKKYPISIKRGVRQGCILSPVLFNTYADEMMKKADMNGGVTVYENKTINKIAYADDTVLIAENARVLEQMLNEVVKEGRKWSIEINKDKTKVMMVTNNKQQEQEDINIKLDGVGIQQVDKFQYLGVFIDNKLDHKIDVKCAVARAKDAFLRHKEFFKNNVPLKMKVKMLKSLIFSLVRYGSEAFALTKTLKKKITSLEFWCYRRILRISWTDMTTNTEVLQRMGLQETFLLQSILKRKASFFGHIARGSAGEELRMIVGEGWRKVGRGRRRRRWMDDLELVTGTRDVRRNMEMAEDREHEKSLVEAGTDVTLLSQPFLIQPPDSDCYYNLMNSVSAYSLQELKGYKSLEAYTYFVSGSICRLCQNRTSNLCPLLIPYLLFIALNSR